MFEVLLLLLYVYIPSALTAEQFSSHLKSHDSDHLQARLGYGVAFQHISHAWMAPTAWPHIFHINIPEKASIPSPKPICNAIIDHSGYEKSIQVSVCGFIEVRETDLYEMQKSQVEHYNLGIEKIHQFLHVSSQNVNEGLRQKRDAGDIIHEVENAFYNFFGIATSRQLSKVAVVAVSAAITSSRNADSIVDLQGTFSTFENLVHTELGLLENQTIANHLKLSRLQTKTTVVELEVEVNNVMEHIFEQQLLLNGNIKEAIHRLAVGVAGLVKGHLTHNLIPFAEMNRALRHISRKHSKLHRNSANVNIPPTMEIYKNARFGFNFNSAKNSAVVVLMVPLTIAEVLTIYKVLQFPQIIHEGTLSSKIETLPQYFAIGNTVASYPSIEEMHKCLEKTGCFLNSGYMSLADPERHDCTTALFLSNKAQVHKKCTFVYTKNTHTPTFIERLSSNTFLISNIKSINVQCHGPPKVYTGCLYCVETFPCNCEISGDIYTFRTELIGCKGVYPSERMISFPPPIHVFHISNSAAASHLLPHKYPLSPVNISQHVSTTGSNFIKTVREFHKYQNFMNNNVAQFESRIKSNSNASPLGHFVIPTGHYSGHLLLLWCVVVINSISIMCACIVNYCKTCKNISASRRASV